MPTGRTFQSGGRKLDIHLSTQGRGSAGQRGQGQARVCLVELAIQGSLAGVHPLAPTLPYSRFCRCPTHSQIESARKQITTGAAMKGTGTGMHSHTSTATLTSLKKWIPIL